MKGRMRRSAEDAWGGAGLKDIALPMAGPGRAAAYLELTKPRITVMALAAAMTGFYLATEGRLDFILAVHAMTATAMVAAGASALNQVLERDADALMVRTRDRPLPAGRVSLSGSVAFGVGFSVMGLVYLGLSTNLLAGSLAALTVVLYVFVYTPLKRRTVFNTLVGAVPGALPPMIGWAAASGHLTWQGGAFFAILYVWQIPHFSAIAWLYRDDYVRGGFKMVGSGDAEGVRTGRRILVEIAALVAVTLLPGLFGSAGLLYMMGAGTLGLLFWGFGLSTAGRRGASDVRRLVLVSVAYLPLLLAVMMLDKGLQ